MKCIYCEKVFERKNGLTLHQKACRSNPNRIAGPNQWSLIGYKIKDETRRKLSEGNLLRGSHWTEETKIQQSIRMKLAVERNPESYTSSNRGRTKQIVYKEIKFQGQWELDFYKWCEDNQIAVERSTEWFDYIWNGNRKYNPDFYIPSMDLYVEVKGYETDRDKAKWSQFPKKLRIIKQQEIAEIRKGCFVRL
jgi:hypothetical protein